MKYWPEVVSAGGGFSSINVSAEGIDPGGGEKSPLAERRDQVRGGLGRLGQGGEGTQAADP